MQAESKASIAMSASRRVPMRSDDWRERSGESGVFAHVLVGSSSGTMQSSPTKENGDKDVQSVEQQIEKAVSEHSEDEDEDEGTVYIPRKKAALRKGSIQQRARCSEEGCDKYAQKGGLCIAHGGVGSNRKPCSVEGCTTLANRWGLCGKHGGFYRCSEEGCDKAAKKGGLCIARFKLKVCHT